MTLLRSDDKGAVFLKNKLTHGRTRRKGGGGIKLGNIPNADIVGILLEDHSPYQCSLDSFFFLLILVTLKIVRNLLVDLRRSRKSPGILGNVCKLIWNIFIC